jgi:toxin ParE1/3/4
MEFENRQTRRGGGGGGRRLCDDIRPGYRKLAAASHILYYRVTPDGVIDVVRVMHQRMDIDRHL